MSTIAGETNLTTASDAKMLAQDLLRRGEIDQAIAVQQSLDLNSPQVLHTIGVSYAVYKGDYQSAINCYEQALQIQEKNGDDISDSLTNLGFAYQNLLQFDLALVFHLRALSIRQLADDINQKSVATNFLGIANAYWGQQNLSEALIYAHKALILNESIISDNNPNIAATLAIFANIYHHSGDDIRALDLAQRALDLLEGELPFDSPSLVSLLNNIGTIQFSAGLCNDALLTFIRALHICERTLPENHPKRAVVIQNIERSTAMQGHDPLTPFLRFSNLLTKFFLM